MGFVSIAKEPEADRKRMLATGVGVTAVARAACGCRNSNLPKTISMLLCGHVPHRAFRLFWLNGLMCNGHGSRRLKKLHPE